MLATHGLQLDRQPLPGFPRRRAQDRVQPLGEPIGPAVGAEVRRCARVNALDVRLLELALLLEDPLRSQLRHRFDLQSAVQHGALHQLLEPGFVWLFVLAERHPLRVGDDHRPDAERSARLGELRNLHLVFHAVRLRGISSLSPVSASSWTMRLSVSGV
ncbi:unnamed protein product [Mycena citricolor]|uniref:Uncharacterized protein n=1 Tax=Mycena citricolor TaxID=2018698 RepID=A0AAD2HRM5_9AGAR|nr:unnamed protein product [Mycena citricolor]